MKRNATKNRLITWAIILLSFSIMYSCKKENTSDQGPVPQVSTMRNLKVLPGFKWQAYQKKKLQINIQTGGDLNHQPIMLYDDQFRLIETATIENNKALFNANFPSTVSALNVFIPATRAALEIRDFNAGTYTLNADVPAKGLNTFIDTISPGCSSGCDRTISNTVYSITVDTNETVCLTGALNGGITLKENSKLIICGTASVSWLSLWGSNAEIIVSSYGTFQAYTLNLYSQSRFYNYSNSCNINGGLNLGSILKNFGTMTISLLNVNSGGTLENYGNISVVNSTSFNNMVDNYGSFTSGGSISINTDKVSNYCKMISNQNITVNQSMLNDGYMRAYNSFFVNGNKVSMGPASMISCQNLTLNGEIAGGNSTCAVKVRGTSIINSTGKITGMVDYCDTNGIETNWGTISSSVVYCQGYLPISSCNPEGIGTPSVTDSDNDGVSDDVDDYPNDPNVAYTNWSPYSGYKTIAFEDLWPSMGDFDFNDVMIKTRTKYRSNAQNKLVDAEVSIILSAAGAGYHNGIALQFLNDQNAAISGLISSVSGASIDPQDNHVVKACDDIFSEQSSYYTNTSLSLAGVPDTLHFTLNFSSSGNLSFNDITEDFFIFRTDNRGLEIHVADRPPSAAASASYFNTFDDDSNAGRGRYYRTANNLPWAIELITGSSYFHNPLEKIEIIDAYPLFQNWATSNGTQNTNWYTSPNPTKIYSNSN